MPNNQSTKRQDYLPWDVYFMAVAQLSAERSKDPNTQVGACIVNEQNQIVATGYNGLPRGLDDDLYPWARTADQWLDTKYPYVCHAEINAILSATQFLTNCRLYVSLFPCHDCAKSIIQAGIKAIIYLSDKYATSDEVLAAKRMLKAAKIKLIQLEQAVTVTVKLTPNKKII